jgi:2-methylcitrate dehydratase PrpD
MTTLNIISSFVADFSFEKLPARTLENVKMHILDTLGAMIIGRQNPEGKATDKLTQKLASPGTTSLTRSIINSCSSTRSTEIDDIHLESCTTMGSVIVPTAFSMADAGYVSDGRGLAVAVALGYDIAIRLGLAVNGATILARGVWPTFFAAPLGSATVGAKVLRLDSRGTLTALSTALAMTSGTIIRPQSDLSTRWLTVGMGAQNGIIGALAAREGFGGDETFSPDLSGQFLGLSFTPARMTEGLGQSFMIDETGMKPFPVARQALAAIDAFREIVAKNKIVPAAIERISVQVPEQLLPVINHPRLSGSRLQATSSVQYQIALAAIDPDGPVDFRHEQINTGAQVTAMMDKVKVEPLPELNSYYPLTWPARVSVTAGGQTYQKESLYPKGDHRNPMNWDEVKGKFKNAAGPAMGESSIAEIVHSIQNLESLGDLSRLLQVLRQ